MTPEDVAILGTWEKLSEDHPDWVIRRSGTGRWWGTRISNPTSAQLEVGFRVSVSADTAPLLDDILDEQDSLATTWKRRHQPDAEESFR